MSNSIKELDYKSNHEKYNLILHELQAENLRLSTKQLKRYFIYSIISFLAGILSAIIVAICVSILKPADTGKLEQRIATLEQSSNQLKDSFRILKAEHTILLDSLKTK